MFESLEEIETSLGGHNVFSLSYQKILFLQTADDFGAGGWCAYALGFLQTFPQCLTSAPMEQISGIV